MKVLVVDDDRRLAEIVAQALQLAGYETDVADGGGEALAKVAASAPDLMLLDFEMPDLDGMAVLDALREPDGTTRVPVLIFTGGRVTAADEVHGLRRGAVDYITKGADPDVLIARVDAAARRANQLRRSKNQIRVGRLRIDVAAARVWIDDQEVVLENRQFALLTYLARRPGEVVSRNELLEEVWGTTYAGFQHAVDQAVYEVRKRLGTGRWIDTVPRRGYRLARG